MEACIRIQGEHEGSLAVLQVLSPRFYATRFLILYQLSIQYTQIHVFTFTQ